MNCKRIKYNPHNQITSKEKNKKLSTYLIILFFLYRISPKIAQLYLILRTFGREKHGLFSDSISKVPYFQRKKLLPILKELGLITDNRIINHKKSSEKIFYETLPEEDKGYYYWDKLFYRFSRKEIFNLNTFKQTVHDLAETYIAKKAAHLQLQDHHYVKSTHSKEIQIGFLRKKGEIITSYETEIYRIEVAKLLNVSEKTVSRRRKTSKNVRLELELEEVDSNSDEGFKSKYCDKRLKYKGRKIRTSKHIIKADSIDKSTIDNVVNPHKVFSETRDLITEIVLREKCMDENYFKLRFKNMQQAIITKLMIKFSSPLLTDYFPLTGNRLEAENSF